MSYAHDYNLTVYSLITWTSTACGSKSLGNNHLQDKVEINDENKAKRKINE